MLPKQARRTSRKHDTHTKPFPQPAAPDCRTWNNNAFIYIFTYLHMITWSIRYHCPRGKTLEHVFPRATSVQYECNWNKTWSPSPQTSPPLCWWPYCTWPPDNATLEDHVVPHNFDNEPVPKKWPLFDSTVYTVDVFCPNTFFQMMSFQEVVSGYGQYDCGNGNKWSLGSSKLQCDHGEFKSKIGKAFSRPVCSFRFTYFGY